MKNKAELTITLTSEQAGFLRALLLTHLLVCVSATASQCRAIIRKIDASVKGQTP